MFAFRFELKKLVYKHRIIGNTTKPRKKTKEGSKNKYADTVSFRLMALLVVVDCPRAIIPLTNHCPVLMEEQGKNKSITKTY